MGGRIDWGAVRRVAWGVFKPALVAMIVALLTTMGYQGLRAPPDAVVTAAGTSHVSGNLVVGGDATVGEDLVVNDDVTLGGNLLVGGSETYTGGETFSGKLTGVNGVEVTGNISGTDKVMVQSAGVTGTLVVTDSVYALGQTHAGGGLLVDHNVTQTAGSTILNAASISTTLGVAGISTLTGAAWANGGLRVTGSLYQVSGATGLNTVSVTGTLRGSMGSAVRRATVPR